jgi:pantoate--beta-alanine ligase
MGALHEGHLSLMRQAAAENDRVVASIFINPRQFGPNEDFDKYPRDLTGDVDKCGGASVDVVFAPSVREMYAREACTVVDQRVLTEVLCGAFRPGHFRGVLTVVAKLLNIVGPTQAYFGQKDYQQCVVIRRMIEDLNMPVEIRICPTVREPDGLAMSSRNQYLSAQERRDALCLFEALSSARQRFGQGERRASELVALMRERVEKAREASIDYVAVVHPDTLQPVSTIERSAVAALAVRIGSTRLIDNMILGEA